MRTILVVLFIILFAIVFLPVYLVVLLIRQFNEKQSAKIAQVIVAYVFKIILLISGTKKTLIGYDNIPKNEPVLFVANHRSFFDIVLLYSLVPRPTIFISKKEVKKVPCIAQWMYLLNCLFLDRDDIRQGLQTILKGVDYAKQGYSVYIAPEGTRNSGEEMLPFKEGSLKIAEKSGCKIIPVAINNPENVFENHFPWIRRAKVIVEFGTPIDVKSLEKEQRKFLGAHVREIIKSIYEKNKEKI